MNIEYVPTMCPCCQCGRGKYLAAEFAYSDCSIYCVIDT